MELSQNPFSILEVTPESTIDEINVSMKQNGMVMIGLASCSKTNPF